MCLHNAPALFLVYLTALFVDGNKMRAFLIATIVQMVTGETGWSRAHTNVFFGKNKLLFFFLFLFSVSGLCAFVLYWDVTHHNSVVLYICMIFPTFALLQGASNIYMLAKERQHCAHRCEGITDCTPDNMCELMHNCCCKLRPS